MKRTLFLAALVATALSMTVAVATAAAPTGNKIVCFGDCTQLSPNRAYLDMGINGGSGVYIPAQPARQLIGDVTKLSFNYNGTGAAPGSPRISIPIATDTTGDTTAFFVFADVIGCNDGSTTVGAVDVINDPTCAITLGDGSSPPTTYPNWAAFVAANPTYRIANDNYTFIIQDSGSPQYTVYNVQLLAKSRGGK